MNAQFDMSRNHEDFNNPLDHVEDVLAAHNWVFERMNNNRLMVQVAGKSCNYNLFFIWQEEMSAMQFCCQYDMSVNEYDLNKASRTIMSINENLWMGHFEIPKENNTPSFRHTCLLRGGNEHSNMQAIEDLVQISLEQCERHYPAFNLLSNDNEALANDQTLELALMETQGEG